MTLGEMKETKKWPENGLIATQEGQRNRESGRLVFLPPIRPQRMIGDWTWGKWSELGQSRLQGFANTDSGVSKPKIWELQEMKFNLIWINCHRNVKSQTWKGHRGSLQKALADTYFTFSTPSSNLYSGPLELGTFLTVDAITSMQWISVWLSSTL